LPHEICPVRRRCRKLRAVDPGQGDLVTVRRCRLGRCSTLPGCGRRHGAWRSRRAVLDRWSPVCARTVLARVRVGVCGRTVVSARSRQDEAPVAPAFPRTYAGATTSPLRATCPLRTLSWTGRTRSPLQLPPGPVSSDGALCVSRRGGGAAEPHTPGPVRPWTARRAAGIGGVRRPRTVSTEASQDGSGPLGLVTEGETGVAAVPLVGSGFPDLGCACLAVSLPSFRGVGGRSSPFFCCPCPRGFRVSGEECGRRSS
jgi:hypothetical protein